MNKYLLAFLGFVGGAALGGAAGYLIEKNLNDKRRAEEINSVLKAYHIEPSIGKSDGHPDAVTTSEYNAVVSNYNPSTVKVETAPEAKKIKYADKGKKVPSKKESMFKQPYIISGKEFGEDDEYRTFTLTLYNDGVLADELDKIVDQPSTLIGEGALYHIGELDEDAVYIRNERIKCEYEVLKDERSYSDVVAQKPYLKEEE